MQKNAINEKHLKIIKLFSKIEENRITKTQASIELHMSRSWVHKLFKRFVTDGPEALVSRKIGKQSNNQLPEHLNTKIITLISKTIYADFGPTLMCEKLYEVYHISVSVETVRRLMISTGIWKCKHKKRPVIHQTRRRRARCGELVQIDGSPHAWFEDRGLPCTLLVFIDDATGLTLGKFVESETTLDYMALAKDYIKKFGAPKAFYSDKHGIFRVNRPGCLKKECITQFGRACKELGIELICANSPQAKGRVERANRTHQDRLVKELRLAGVSTIAEGNKFLEESGYWKRHNDKFAIKPECCENAHSVDVLEELLDKSLCIKEYRKISKNLEFQYKNTLYQISLDKHPWRIVGARITITEKLDGTVCAEYENKPIEFKPFAQQSYVGQEVDSKNIDRFLKGGTPRKVSLKSPWRHFKI
jgi:hypothetical protein